MQDSISKVQPAIQIMSPMEGKVIVNQNNKAG